MRVAFGKTGIFRRVQPGVHAGEDRELPRRRQGELAFVTEMGGVGAVGGNDLVMDGAGHGFVLVNTRPHGARLIFGDENAIGQGKESLKFRGMRMQSCLERGRVDKKLPMGKGHEVDLPMPDGGSPPMGVNSVD